MGELRDTTMGSRPPTQDTMYPTFRRDSFAAWCWTGHGPYNVYEVTSDGKAHMIARAWSSAANDAHGAPIVP